jgi:hypothetical protein
MSQNILNKPNQTIMITNKEITALQRKAYNVLLNRAAQQLKDNSSATTFSIGISEIKTRAGIKDSANVRLKEELKTLKRIEIDIVKENSDWTNFNLLGEIRKNGDKLEFELPRSIRESILQNDYYTTIDLLILKTLTGKYAVILYEIAIRYHKVQIPPFSLAEFRDLTGTTDIYTKNFYDFEKRVIKPAIEEINTKTELTLDYNVSYEAKKPAFIKFIIVSNKKEKLPEIVLSAEECDKINTIIKDKIDFKTISEVIIPYKNNYDFEFILFCLRKSMSATKSICNYFERIIDETKVMNEYKEQEHKKKTRLFVVKDHSATDEKPENDFDKMTVEEIQASFLPGNVKRDLINKKTGL